MAGQTFFTVIGDRLGGLVVRIVAGAAPEFLVAAAGAMAERQLFDVADHFKGACG